MTLTRISFRHWVKLALIAAMLSTISTAAPVKLRLFLLGGQSNAWGIGETKDLPPALQQPQTNVKFYPTAWDNSLDGKPAVWQPLAPVRADGGSSVGPYVTFGHDMAAGLPSDSVGVYSCTNGATSLAVNWLPPSSGGKRGGGDRSREYFAFVDNLRSAITKLGSTYQVEVSGMIWMQGESDAGLSSDANAYKTNLTNFIGDLRKEFSVPNTPFVIAMIDPENNWGLDEVVRQAERDVAATVPNVGIFDTKGFPLGADNTDGGAENGHYNTQGQMILGSMFAGTMLRMLSNPARGSFVDPSEIIGTVPSSGQVKLTWRDNSETESGFVVERRAGAGAFTQLSAPAAGTGILASFTDNTVSASTVHTYRVKALNGTTSSAYSSEFSFVPYGAGTGLKAEYFTSSAMTGTPVLTRVDTTINWGGGAIGSGVTGTFSVRWTGYIMPRYTELVYLLVESDKLGTVWIDNQKVVDPASFTYLYEASTPRHSGPIQMTAGQPRQIKVEYTVSGGNWQPRVQLKWISPSQALQVIPQSQLYQTAPGTVAVEGHGVNHSSQKSRAVTNRAGILTVNALAGSRVRVADLQGRLVRESVLNASSDIDVRKLGSRAYVVLVANGRGASVRTAVVCH